MFLDAETPKKDLIEKEKDRSRRNIDIGRSVI